MDIQRFVEIITRSEYAPNFRLFPYWGLHDQDLSPPWFEPDAAGASVTSATWSLLRPDLLLSSRTEGLVHLRPLPGEQIPPTHPCRTFRQHKIWSAGKATRESLVVYCDFSLVLFLRQGGLRVENLEDPANEGLHEIFLDGFTYESFRGPEVFDEIQVGRQLQRLLQLQAALKVYNHFYKHLTTDRPAADLLPSPPSAYALRLIENGITDDNVYCPTEQGAKYGKKPIAGQGPTLSIKGLSNFPTVAEVIDRRKSGREQTTAGKLMLPAVELALSASVAGGLDSELPEITRLRTETEEGLRATETELRAFYYSSQLFGSRLGDHPNTPGSKSKFFVDDQEFTLSYPTADDAS